MSAYDDYLERSRERFERHFKTTEQLDAEAEERAETRESVRRFTAAQAIGRGRLDAVNAITALFK